ncbi:MAG TPA: AEC family transporter [Bacillales bacterium]|nr:AEC family transporter [Bacillales bacterium]
MTVIWTIFTTVILPLFILVAVGVLLHRLFDLDNRTLSKLNLYYLVPALIFAKVYEAELSADLFLHVIAFLLLQFVALLLVSQAFGRIFHYDKPFLASFTNSIVLTNNGNFGIPVNQLAFRNDPYALAVQIVVLAFQNFLTFTFGLFNAGVSSKGLKEGIAEFFKIPIFYALVIGVAFNVTHVQLPNYVWEPISQAADGFIALALVTLGVQVATLRFKKHLLPIAFSSFIRLIVGPAFGLLFIFVLGLDGLMAKALLIAAALPTSRNSAILALEYGNESEYAAQAVIVSTLCSGVTITLVIYVANLLF